MIFWAQISDCSKKFGPFFKTYRYRYLQKHSKTYILKNVARFFRIFFWIGRKILLRPGNSGHCPLAVDHWHCPMPFSPTWWLEWIRYRYRNLESWPVWYPVLEEVSSPVGPQPSFFQPKPRTWPATKHIKSRLCILANCCLTTLEKEYNYRDPKKVQLRTVVRLCRKQIPVPYTMTLEKTVYWPASSYSVSAVRWKWV